MKNIEKFKEVFGFYPADNQCISPSDFRCQLICENCLYGTWWDDEYTGKSKKLKDGQHKR